MGLNNIHKSKQKILNRPMFAKIKDGTIKPVQYANVGMFIQGGKYTLPYLQSASRALTKIPGIDYAKNYAIQLPAIIKRGLPDIYRKYVKRSDKKLSAPPSGAGQGDVLGLASRMNLPVVQGSRELVPYVSKLKPYNLKNMINPALTMSTLATLPYLTEGMTETETETEKSGVTPPSSDPGHFEDEFGRMHTKTKFKKGKEKITDTVTEEIKSGNMDEMIKEKISLFEKYLGKDTKERKKGAVYNAMVEFGLNLASVRGGNTMDKIARSAKDPLANFAKVGQEIVDRAEKIKMGGIESGIQSFEKAEDRAVDREAIAADVYIEKLKLQAPKTDRLTFVSEKFDSIAANPDLVYSLTDFAYTKDKSGKRVKRPEFENQSDGQILQSVIDDMWRRGNAVELPSGAVGDELYESLPSGTYYLDVETGTYNTKP